MGAAGDMLQGTLVSLLNKEGQEFFISKINNLGIEGVSVLLSDDVKCGITAKHVSVMINGDEEESQDVHEHDDHHGHDHDHSEGHDHHHDGENGHHHHSDHDGADHHHDDAQGHDGENHHHHGHHHHTSMHDIEHMISHLDVSDRVKRDVLNVYKIIAEAESKVHGKSASEIHFHEVGMKDALIDITGTAMLMEMLDVDRVIVSPVNVGFGKVKCAHGILPVPAPATAEIISDIPTYSGRFEGEMCTPTGAALLKYYADEFSYQPVMTVEKTGYGSGKKSFEAANVIKASIGTDYQDNAESDRVIELKCNVDDMTGEDMAYAVDVLFDNNVKDAFVTPVIMKKGRSGMLLTVLCDEADREKIASLIFKHTSTIGIRETITERMVLKRFKDTVHTEAGDVSVKVSEGFGVKKMKPEFKDLKALSEKTGKSVSEIRKIVEKNWRE